jgi:hypothetical protein
MSDYFARFERQLVAAERELALGHMPVTVAGRRRPWRLTRRRAGSLAIALGLIAGPAAAAVQPWRFVLGRPEIHDTPHGEAVTPTPAGETSVLAVLRRPQNDADRSADAQKLLRSVGVEFAGVREDSVRVVAAGSHTVAVLTAEHVGDPSQPDRGGLKDVVCLTNAVGGTCGSIKTLLGGHLASYAGPHVMGLAPDGVATVVLRYSGGRSISAPVRDNVFFSDSAPTATVPGTSTTPDFTVSAAPTSIDWLDQRGHRIGPR